MYEDSHFVLFWKKYNFIVITYMYFIKKTMMQSLMPNKIFLHYTKKKNLIYNVYIYICSVGTIGTLHIYI